MVDIDEEKILEKAKDSVWWNECNGNAGYKLISTDNVESLIACAIKDTKYAMQGLKLEFVNCDVSAPGVKE